MDLGVVKDKLIGLIRVDLLDNPLHSGNGLLVVGGTGHQVGHQVGVLIFAGLLQQVLVDVHCRLVIIQLVLLKI